MNRRLLAVVILSAVVGVGSLFYQETTIAGRLSLFFSGLTCGMALATLMTSKQESRLE